MEPPCKNSTNGLYYKKSLEYNRNLDAHELYYKN